MARLTGRYQADQIYKAALTLYAKGKLTEAIEEIGHAIQLYPRHPEYFAARGLFHLENGDAERAAINFDEAIFLNPYEMLAHFGRGRIAYNEKDWDAALEHFNLAWAADPERGETYYYMALLHHRTGDNQTALQWMQHAQGKFEEKEDKRARDAKKWIAEFEKIGKNRNS